MTDLGVEQTVQQLAIDENPATDSGANGDVNERIDALPCSPEVFSEHGGVHIRVPGDGDVVAIMQLGHDVGELPAGLGRGGDVAVRLAVFVEIDRAKGANANGGDGAVFRLGHGQETVDARQRVFRRCRRNTNDVTHIVRAGADCADELGAAGLDSGNKGQFFAHDCGRTEAESRMPRLE